MQFLQGKSTIDFMGKRKHALIFSLTLVIISLVSIAIDGLNFGIDFTGGYLIEVGYERDIEITPVRKALTENGYQDAQVQHFGTARDILVRIAPREDINKASISDELFGILKANTDQQITMRRVEFVGPQVGEELREQGGLALLVALGGILVYISFRFQFKSAVGAILSLIHDVIITVGVFAVTQMEFDLTVLAALLAVIGYSLNDTVVVLDRIRETFRGLRKTIPHEVLNLSINQTLSRTLMTSMTTLLVLVALFLLGGEVIHGFAFALIVGIFIGTYSSIYVASSTLMLMDIKKQDFLEATKEEVVDDRP
jgi:preprotein translocase subunit SecF